GPATATDVEAGPHGRGGRETTRSVSVDWDETGLAKMEQAAISFAQAHRDATSCGHRPRFQFALHGGLLHGDFVAWKPVDQEELASRRGPVGVGRVASEGPAPRFFLSAG